jgi:hypothetical protein
MERTPLEKAKACCGKLHDRGTDKLLAAIASAPDAKPCAECGRPTLGAFGPAPQFNYWRSICQSCKDKADGELERQVKGSAAAVDQMVRSSLGLPVNVGNQERRQRNWINFDSTKPDPTNVGPCGLETDHDRHNDDDAQRAAQERADAEVNRGE